MPAGIKRIFQTKLADNSVKDKEGVGTIRWEGNKCYKYIKFNNGAGNVAAVAGYVAYYYGVSGDAVTGGYETNTVTMDRTDSMSLGAGVFQVALTDAYYGWIQIKGPATLAVALTAGADGDPLTPVDAGADGTLTVANADTDAICAHATDISAKKIACDFPF